jgi:hypothetical protein
MEIGSFAQDGETKTDEPIWNWRTNFTTTGF